VSELSVFSKPRVNEWSHKRVNPSKLICIGLSCMKHFGCGTEWKEKKYYVNKYNKMCICASYYEETPSHPGSRTEWARGEQSARYPEVETVLGRLQTKPKKSFIILFIWETTEIRRHGWAAVSRNTTNVGLYHEHFNNDSQTIPVDRLRFLSSDKR
jgi:hypothetical protein